MSKIFKNKDFFKEKKCISVMIYPFKTVVKKERKKNVKKYYFSLKNAEISDRFTKSFYM